MNGTASKQLFSIIKNNPNQTTSIVNASSTNECCFELPCLAELTTKTSDLKNDKHSVIWFFDNGYTDAELVLQKYENNTWIDKEILTDNTYGTNYALDFYTTIFDEKAIGYLIDWFLVLNDLGEGNYRIKCNATQIDTTIQNYYSFEFCLKKYTDSRANYTTRLDWYKNGINGSIQDDTKRLDFGTLNWFNSIRLPNSIFGKLKPTKTKNVTRYQTVEEVRLSDSDEIEFELSIDSIPLWLAKFIAFDANYNTQLSITDYNEINHEEYIQKQVIAKSSFNISEYDMEVKLIDVNFTYQPRFNNFKHNYE